MVNFEDLHKGSLIRNMASTYWLVLEQKSKSGNYLWIRKESKNDVIYNVTDFTKNAFKTAFLEKDQKFL